MQQLIEVRDTMTPDARAYTRQVFTQEVRAVETLDEIRSVPEKRDTIPGSSIVPPSPALDIRLNHWVYRQVTTTGRIVRLLSWLVMLYPRVRLFAGTMASGFVDKETYDRRMVACADCDRHLKRIVKTEPELVTKSYCMQCGCPEWALSQLERKNWFKGWQCPARKHAGVYPEDAYRRYVTLQAPPRRGGCGGG